MEAEVSDSVEVKLEFEKFRQAVGIKKTSCSWAKFVDIFIEFRIILFQSFKSCLILVKLLCHS